MALATPLEIPPTTGFNSKVFDIGDYQQIGAGSPSGFVQTYQRSEPLWYAEYTTPPLNDTRYDEFIAFKLALEGAMETFLAYDPRRPMPRAYQNLSTTSDPWTQTGQTAPRCTVMDYTASTLTLDRLQNGAVITSGDYIAFQVGLIWYLFRAQTGATAAGNTATIIVKPRPHLFSGALPVNVRYRKACCQMKIMGGIKEDDSVDSFPKFSFKAFQFLDRSTP